MASLGSASTYRAYSQGHSEPCFEGDLRRGPFGARVHEAFGYPGTGDGRGWGSPEGHPAGMFLSAAGMPQHRAGGLRGEPRLFLRCPLALWTAL